MDKTVFLYGCLCRYWMMLYIKNKVTMKYSVVYLVLLEI